MSARSTTTRSTPSSVRAICACTDCDALADLDRGRVHLDQRAVGVGGDPHARGRVVVEALREADVLDPDGVADAAAHALAVRRVRHSAGQLALVGRAVGRRRERHVAHALEQLGDGRRLGDSWPVGSVSPGAIALRIRSSTGSIAERGGELVHLRLVRERDLHGAEAAHRAARRVVRVGDERGQARVRHRVGAGGEARGVRADGGRAGRVGAAVEHDPRVHVDEPAVRVGAVLVLHPAGMAVHVADERLLARVDHLHGAARAQREHAGVDLHREVLAPAERAADPAERQPHRLGREAEALRHLVAVDVQPLRRDVQLDAAGAVRHREARLGAEEGLVLHPDLVAPAARRRRRSLRVAALGCARGAARCRPRAAPGRAASSPARRRVTGSSTSKSTAIRSAAWRAVSGWSAATIASGSPLKRTSLHASTGWSACSSP